MEPKSISTFLSENKKLIIPEYQRDFSWDNQQFSDLWTDIDNIEVNKKNSNSHFLGLIVLIVREDSNYDVVDGQQRLTALFILLSVIKNKIKDLNKIHSFSYEDDLIENLVQINNILYIGDNRDLKLIPNNNDVKLFNLISSSVSQKANDIVSVKHNKEKKVIKDINNFILKHLLEDTNRDNRKLKARKAFKALKLFTSFVNDRVDQEKEIEDKKAYLNNLIKKIMDNLKIMEYKTNNESDAFNLFETLNDRGLGLAAVDLIKNQLLRRTDDLIKDEVLDIWDNVFGSDGKLHNENSNTFLRHYYNSKYPFISTSEIYKKYKDVILETDPKDTQKFCEKLDLASDNYLEFKNVYIGKNKELIDDKELSELLYLLNKTRSTQWYSIAFPLYKQFKETEDKNVREKVKLIFWNLLIIVLRFIVSEVRFNLLEKNIPILARSLSNLRSFSIKEDEDEDETFEKIEDALDHVFNELNYFKELYVNDDKFTNVSKNSEEFFYSDFDKNNIPTILLRLFYSNHLSHGVILEKEMTLEHVLPIKHKKNWNQLDNESVKKIKFKLGNMVLLKGDLNSSVSNGGYITKKKAYKEMKVNDYFENENDKYSIEKINDQKDWNENLVSTRTEIIVKKLIEIMNNENKLPFSKKNDDNQSC